MSWLRSMRGKAGSGEREHQAAAARPSSKATSMPAVDWNRLRESIPAAPSAGERAQRERELGRACAAHGKTPLPGDAPGVWTEAVCHANDKAAATQWAVRLEGDASLAEAAARCRFAEVRLAAARRISDLAVLKQLADSSREKDKHVYRHCTDALRAYRQSGERARRAAQLTLDLRALLDARPVAVSRLLQIEKEFAALGEDKQGLAECADLVAQAQDCVLAETRAQIGLRARLAAAEALRSDVAGADSPSRMNLEAWRSRYTDIAEEAAGAPAWLAKFPATRELAHALRDIESRLAALVQDLERATEREKVLASLPPVEQPAPKIQKPAKREVDHAGVQRSLDELERHLEDGRLADADAVASSIEQAIDGAAPRGLLALRWQRARAQLMRLQGWARWGTDQAREQLIADAEALLRSAPGIDDRARAVPALHKEWKRLDAHGPAAKPLWERFDKALEEAYRPVRKLRATEALRHEAARAAKAALCDACEAWLAKSSLAPPDYRALAAERDEITAKWRAGAMAGFRDERKLRKRLDALLKRIDVQVEEAQAKEIARREQLLAAAEGLRDAPDIARAVNEAKSLQSRWKDEAGVVRLRHGAEQTLWQRFRAACDAVFARRDAERTAQAAQREQRMQALQDEKQARDLKRREEQDIELLRKARHANRFALMAQKAARADPSVNPSLAAVALEQGRARRAALLIDLEIALELPTPETDAAARRARSLVRLQDRFRGNSAAPQDPEAMVAQWYAVAAMPDAEQTMRMAAIVQRLLERTR